MNIFEEIHQENMQMLLETLAKRTLEGKQKWTDLRYLPISFLSDDGDYDTKAYVNQSYELCTCFNGIEYGLELVEQIQFPMEKGDIAGCIVYEGEEGYMKHDFGLYLDFPDYDDTAPANLLAQCQHATSVKLAEAVATLFNESSAVQEGFSYARFYNEKQIKQRWKRNKVIRLSQRLMDEKNMWDFHRIVLDVECRNALIDLLEIK